MNGQSDDFLFSSDDAMEESHVGRSFAVGAIAILFACFVLQAAANLTANSQTFDEAVHLAAGDRYLRFADFSMNPEHPPLTKVLAALPAWLIISSLREDVPNAGKISQWDVGRHYLYNSGASAERLLTLGRIPNVFLGLCILFVVARWSFLIWGPWAAIFTTGLLAFDPNLVAHSCVATTDVGAALFYLLTIYTLWRYLRSHLLHHLVLTGLSFGAALASKFSMIVLIPTIGVILLVKATFFEKFAMTRDIGRRWFARQAQAGVVFVGLLLLAELVVWLSYFGHNPMAWYDGIVDQQRHNSMGHSAFLLGDYSRNGWYSYFLVAFLVKTPLGSMVAMLLGLVSIGRIWHSDNRFASILFVSLLTFAILASLSRLNLGIRYILPIYVLMFIPAGVLVSIDSIQVWKRSALCVLLVTATALESLSIAPHQLSFFNRTVGGPLKGDRYLSDSNIDWGQDLRSLSKWLAERGNPNIYLSYFGTAPPAYYGIGRQFLPGFGNAPSDADQLMPLERNRELLVISVVNLQGVYFDDHQLFSWLRRRQPIARIGYSILVYELADDVDAHRQLARIYTKYGYRKLAAAEDERAGR